MKLHPKEIENVVRLKPFERYKYFIKKVADYEELWTIVDEKGDIALSVVDGKTFISFWTAEAFIKGNLEDSWKECVPFKIDLDDFEDTIISLIAENDYLINVFPAYGKSGFVVNINEFMRDLNEELERYQ